VGSHRSEFGYDSYLGIPFAEPPVGPLRFAHPKANTYPDDTIVAQQWSPACLQLPVPVEGIPDIGGQYGQSEDCLYLNVFTPQGKHEEPLPVMLWM
jgi:carboxylesterase type B